mmetsp:Transcript_2887/g.7188  ORF Transcript_2887/g.7188 Transcript_2887/m.7188 type:complete len:229 (-) Transcript_2887:498-1184(-)
MAPPGGLVAAPVEAAVLGLRADDVRETKRPRLCDGEEEEPTPASAGAALQAALRALRDANPGLEADLLPTDGGISKRVHLNSDGVPDELQLQACAIMELPGEFFQLPFLRKLWLSQNSMESLPSAVENFCGLQWLWLTSNRLRSLPAELGNLAQLQKLWLNLNQLREIPKELGQLAQLSWLDLSDNLLTDIPEEIGQLNLLTRLDLHSNKLRTIKPGVFANLQKVNRL